MEQIELRSYAKINLSLDVLSLMENGYHEISTVMQQVGLWDLVSLSWEENSQNLEGVSISLTTNRRYLPTDSGNIAYKAAALMAEHYGDSKRGRLKIHIQKRIPVAAGLAGGSGNGAAVLHGINLIWKLGLSLKTLCELGELLGSDVPFCLMGQAKSNGILGPSVTKDPLAATCALATGTGTVLNPLPAPDNLWAVLSKPSVRVSTPEVYRDFDLLLPGEISYRPDTEELIEGLKEKNRQKIINNMINVLENVTLKRYPNIVVIKERLTEAGAFKTLMSGSGPTVYGLFTDYETAKTAELALKEINRETYLAKIYT